MLDKGLDFGRKSQYIENNKQKISLLIIPGGMFPSFVRAVLSGFPLVFCALKEPQHDPALGREPSEEANELSKITLLVVEMLE